MTDGGDVAAVRQIQRRSVLLGSLGLGAVGAQVLRPSSGLAQPKTSGAILTVGRVAVTKIDISRITLGSPDMLHDTAGCKLASGGIHFHAEVRLEPRPGTQRPYYGRLWLLQNTNYGYQRIAARTGDKYCAGSNGIWELDGKVPYLGTIVTCAPGSNTIDHTDDPNVLVEDSSTPYETTATHPVCLFRTFLVWETTANSQRPSRVNIPRRHYIGRVDWRWQAAALSPPPVPPPACTSTPFKPVGWGVAPGGIIQAKAYTGALALFDPSVPQHVITPVYQPSANIIVWHKC